MTEPPDTVSSGEGVRDDTGSVTRRAAMQALGTFVIGRPVTEIGADATDTSEACGQYDVVNATEDGAFRLQVNAWSAAGPEVQQCVSVQRDGSYGWDWDRDSTGVNTPNYPEVFFGAKLWGPESPVDVVPQRRGSIDEFTVRYDVDMTAAGGEWNLALDWWLTDTEPPTGGAHEFEVMLLLDWSPVHAANLGPVQDPAAIHDTFGNTIDYWRSYGLSDADIVWLRHRRASYADKLQPSSVPARAYERAGTAPGAWRERTDGPKHIFRIDGGSTAGRVDLTEVFDYMSERFGVGSDLWLSGLELGNENWDDTSGTAVVDRFDITVNGTTYTSGTGSDSLPSQAVRAFRNV